MKIKSILLLLGVLLFSPTLFVACSDDDDDLPKYIAGNYHYDVIVLNNDYSLQINLDSVKSEVTEITNLPEWIKMEQLSFDQKGHPIMKIDVQADPRGKSRDSEVVLKTKGGDVVNLSFTQSYKYSNLGFHSDNSGFDVTNWFEVEEINIYDRHLNALRSVNLPWASRAPTAMPAEYRKVNKNHDLWKLCFNTCSDPNLPDTQMFGLFNINNHTLRVYVYFMETPSNATTCYFVVSVDKGNSAILSGDNLNWAIPMDVAQNRWNMPTDSLIENIPVNMSSTIIAPVCGNLTGSISPGWVAFDIPLTSTFNTVNDIITNQNTDITISLLSCDITNTTGTQDFSEIKMKDDNIEIKSPGSSTKRTSLGLAAAGNFLQGVGGLVANTAMTGATGAGAGGAAAVAIIGGAGLIFNLASDCIEADEAGKDQIAYTMSLDFQFSGKTKINTQSITYRGNNFTPITMNIGSLFEYMIAYKSKSRRSPQKDSGTNEKINFGVWNLVKTPTIYVSKDVLFYNESKYGTEYNSDGSTITSFGNDENLRYASFLDPSSIQVYINDDTSMFPHDDVKNVQVVAYDFMYEDTSYDSPDIFYNYYKISNEELRLTTEDDSWNYIFTGDSKSMRLVECNDKDLLLDPENGKLTYKTMRYLADDLGNTGYTFKYGGVYSDFPNEIAPYNAFFSPIVYVPRNSNGLYPVKNHFANLGVAVVVTFDIGDRQYCFARRFLPEIKMFSNSDISGIRNKINNFNNKTSDGLSADYKLFDKEKAKALRVLSLVEQ